MLKESKPTFSICLCAYNAQKYLSRAIESVMTQTFDDFELILLNDGSTDNTLSIMRLYESNYPWKIHVYSQKNQGLSVSRRNCVAYANGRYIMFIDADDELLSYSLEKINIAFDQFGTDIIQFNFKTDNSVEVGCKSRIFSSEVVNCRDLFLNLVEDNICLPFWSRAYKRDVLSVDGTSVFAGTYLNNEDEIATPSVLLIANTIAYIDEALYIYYLIPESITHDKQNHGKYARCVLEAFNHIWSVLTLVNPNDDACRAALTQLEKNTYIAILFRILVTL